MGKLEDNLIKATHLGAKDLLGILGPAIGYHPKLAKALGGVNAAILTCQFLYWSNKVKDPDGWLYKTMEDLTEETGLTISEQRSARKQLRTLKILTEKKKGVPPVNHYRMNWDVLLSIILGDDQRCIKLTIEDAVNASTKLHLTHEPIKGDIRLLQKITTIRTVFDEFFKISGKKNTSPISIQLPRVYRVGLMMELLSVISCWLFATVGNYGKTTRECASTLIQ